MSSLPRYPTLPFCVFPVSPLGSLGGVSNSLSLKTSKRFSLESECIISLEVRVLASFRF